MTTLATFPLRLPVSVKAEAEALSKADGTSLNQFVAIAVAEKIAVLKTAAFFEERRQRSTGTALAEFLARPGGEPPRAGDELPEGWVPVQPSALPVRKRGATQAASAKSRAKKKPA